MKGKLYLLPNLLGDHLPHQVFLPSSVDKAVSQIDGLIAESEGGGRRFLSRFETKKKPHEIPIALLNKHTKNDELDFILEPIIKGENWGVVSDAGLPCIADPGAMLIARAQKLGIKAQAFVGPSSIFLSLMLSGLSGQNFHFCGYLPKDQERKRQKILEMQEQAIREESTQIFIEAPHRNRHTLEVLLETLNDDTDLCVAWDLTLPTQGILTQKAQVWKKSPLPNIDKKPTTFLFGKKIRSIR